MGSRIIRNGLYSLLLFVWVQGQALLAQSPLELTKITIEQGLPQGYVASACQDQEGFMWFGTNDGLCRYDGYEFLVFRHDPFDPFSIAHNSILQVVKVGAFLCVANYSGIDLLDPTTQRFYHLTSKPAYVSSDGNQVLYFLAQHLLQRLVLTPDVIAQLYRANAGAQSAHIEELLSGDRWIKMCLSEDERVLWLLKEDGRDLFRLDLPARQIQQFPIEEQLLKITTDGANGVWLCGKHILAHFDGTRLSNPWHKIHTTYPVDNLWHFDPHHQLLWLEMDQECGFHFDLQHLPEVIGPEQAQIRLSIPEGVVYSMTDQLGIVWFGTNAHGIRQFNPRSAAFKNYLPELSIYSNPFSDDHGDIWLGRINKPAANDKSGNRLRLSTGQLLPYPFAALTKEMFALYTIADDEGGLWTSGQHIQKPMGKLIYYHPRNGQTEVFHYPIDTARYFNVLELRYEAPDFIWIYLPYQMLCFHRKTQQFITYDYSQLTIGEQSVMAVAHTPDGSHWIALPKSIIRAKPDDTGNYQFSKLQNDPFNRNSLPINNIKCLLTDPEDANILWIGTGGGLSRLDTRTGHFTHYTTQNGLSNDVVYGIVPENSNLWLSTNKGLIKFNPGTGQFQYFLQSDGLPGNEFNTYAYGKTPDGRLIFGGVNGLTVFNPKELSVNMQPPKVRFTALRVNGMLLGPRDSASLLDKNIEFTETLELSHTQNNLVLQFAALDYAKPERNQFQFYLEGAEPKWAHHSLEHTAQYLNLSPGIYTFQVKAANSDGIWNDTPITLRIIIHPPWYASWYAYALYFMLLAGAAYGFYQIQLRRRLDHAETKRLQELDQVKTRLYTNITHEFRTPLTVILGVTEQVKQYLAGQHAKNQVTSLEIVQRNGSQLLQLINQLLDLSKLEAGSMTLQVQRGDIVAFYKYITDSFHSYANGQGVQVHFLTDMPSFEMDYDAEKMQMIVINLLSNAIKFTPGGGHVYVQVREIEQKKQPWLSLQVKDTGVGIAPEKLPFVFDRFYQADDTLTKNAGGTGIGLALVRELVRLMNGNIQVSSKPGEGTVFTVLVPVTRLSEIADSLLPMPSVLSLPAVSAAPNPLLTSEHPDPSDKRPWVLMVEDHLDVANYVAACLHDQYRVILASNGQLGIEQAFDTIPDLIISDVMMPGKDGFEVCELLKNDERTSHIPIVLLTAKTNVEDRITGFQHKADAYLAKPFHPEELRIVLSNLLELRQKLQVKYTRNDWSANNIRSVSQSPNPQKVESPDPEAVFLQKLQAVVIDRLSDSTLTGEEVCRTLGMSYPVIYRKLSALTGRSLNIYIRLIRLQQACQMLRSTTLTISEIAYEVGFNDPKFFSRVFSEEFGSSPSAFRQAVV